MTARGIFASTVMTLSAVIGLAGSARAQDCQPGIGDEYVQGQADYDMLIAALVPELGQFTTEIQTVTAATYPALLAHAQAVAGSAFRVVLTLPDGTVVVDTGKSNNSFADFQAKTINENHNSRLAIFSAQQYPCSVGIERKFSTSTGAAETAVAVRLGDHLSSNGTVRISK